MRLLTGDEAFLGEERQLKILRYVLYSFNLVFLVAAAIVFAAGMYVTYETSIDDYISAMEMDFYLNAVAVLMFASVVVVLSSFVGCCAGFLISRRALILYVILSVISFIMLLVASAFLLANGLAQSNLYPYIQVTMRDLIYQYEKDVIVKTKVDTIQEKIGCCGGFGYNDYLEIHLPIPDTCRNQVTGNQYIHSCGEELSWFMEKKTGFLCGVSLCLCFLQIFAVITAFYAYRGINRLRKRPY